MSDWLRAGDKHEEGESTSLASDRIQWDRYVYKLAHLSLGSVWMSTRIVAVDSTVILRLIH